MRLSTQQLAFFHRFGYVIVRKLFDQREMATISDAFERTMGLCGLDRLPDGTRRGILGPIQHLPEMNALLDHPGVTGLAGSVLGDDFNYVCGDASYYTGDTAWHADGTWGQLFAAKIVVYLEPLTRETGALRVIPGSHDPRHPLRLDGDQPRETMAQVGDACGITGRSFPGAEAFESEPGDVLMFNHDLFHAAFGGGNRRRMFTMNLTRHCESAEDLERLRRYVSIHSPGGYRLPIGGLYFRPILDSASPERMRHLEQPRRIHDELFPALIGRQTHAEQIANMMRVLHPEVLVAAS
jgi:hypothetical protein